MKFIKYIFSLFIIIFGINNVFANGIDVIFITKDIENPQERLCASINDIVYCDGATINLQGATILAEYAINDCDGATINLNKARIWKENAIDYCHEATINLERATISAKKAIFNCDGATINLQGAHIWA